MTKEEAKILLQATRLMMLGKDNQPISDLYYALEKGIEALEEKPKTGHWIDIMVGDMPAQACDQCNTFYPLSYTGGGHNYCPSCGAKMDEEVSK